MLPSGWKDSRIQELIIGLESGVSVNGENRKKATNEKAVLKVSAVSYGYFDPTACKVINHNELVRAKTNPKAGEIIISRSNTEIFVGASAYIDSNYENLYLADKLWQTISKPKTDMKWLSYILASDHPRYTLSKLATGTSGSMKNITKGEFLTLKVPTPPFSEQQKIAQILSTWDKAISTTESLITNSQQQKKALMQQLLTGQKRLLGLDEEFKEYKLEQVCHFKRGKGLSKGLLNSDGKYKCILYGQLYTKYNDVIDNVISRTNATDSIKSICGDVLIPSSTTTSGIDLANAVALLEDDVLLGGDINILRPNIKKVCPEFLAYLLTHIKKNQIASIAQGITIIHLYGADLKPLLVRLPTLKEQQKIASVLSSVELEIKTVQQKLTHLKQEKKALMQQLLTGKRRVKA